MLGEGTCVENIVQRELAVRKSYDSNEMETTFVQFATSCSCEIINNSVFKSFV